MISAQVTLHARTATQRYGRAATWEDVEACARKAGANFPVLGNGDVLTHFEARRKRAVAPTAAGLMVGRGALINPWLFDDIRNEESWLPTAEERLEVYYSLVAGYRDTSGAVHKRGAEHSTHWLVCAQVRRRRARKKDGVVLRALPL